MNGTASFTADVARSVTRAPRALRRLAAAALLALAVGAGGTGCASAPVVVKDPLTAGRLGGNDAADRMEFWYQLANRPVISHDEAFHALLLYTDGTDPAADYAGRVATLRERGMLPGGFDGTADAAVDRGTLAVALAKALDVRGGVTMSLVGPTPRYATRALQARGVYPANTSPNQSLTGAELVATIGRAEDYQRGNPVDAPAALLPGEVTGDAPVQDQPPPAGDPPQQVKGGRNRPVMLSAINVLDVPADVWWAQDTRPAGPDGAGNGAAPQRVPTKDRPAKLKAIITGVEGDLVEVRKSPDDPWAKARVGMSVPEAGEFRTGPKSAVRFVIPPDQVYTLDRQGTCGLLQAVYDGKRVTAEVGMQRGRVRLDVAPIAKPPPATADAGYRIEEAGVEHGVMIRSPSAALAVRGTLVSLYDEAGFAPEAVSLTGRAEFRNVRRQLVAFGGAGAGKTVVRGDQSSAAQQSLLTATAPPNPEVANNDFDLQQTTILLDRGGFQRGDVLTGNSRVTDAQLVPALPGVLNFVLRWTGGAERKLNDLNLVVVSPEHSSAAPDFVGNPPFPVSLAPGDPVAEATRARLYPRGSRTGGHVSKNHVGPEGLEFASWPKDYPAGNYRVVVYNLLDAVPGPEETVNPVNYTIDVFLNKRVLVETITGTVGELQTAPAVTVPVPASETTAAATPKRGPHAANPSPARKPAGRDRAPAASPRARK